jgi:hypothetical protein
VAPGGAVWRGCELRQSCIGMRCTMFQNRL